MISWPTYDKKHYRTRSRRSLQRFHLRGWKSLGSLERRGRSQRLCAAHARGLARRRAKPESASSTRSITGTVLGTLRPGNTLLPFKRRLSCAAHSRPDTWGGELRKGFEPLPGEIVASEHWCSSGFGGTDLDLQLKKHGIERIIVIGLIAHTCIEATVRFGAELGYDVTVIKDATAGLLGGNDACSPRNQYAELRQRHHIHCRSCGGAERRMSNRITQLFRNRIADHPGSNGRSNGS